MNPILPDVPCMQSVLLTGAWGNAHLREELWAFVRHDRESCTQWPRQQALKSVLYVAGGPNCSGKVPGAPVALGQVVVLHQLLHEGKHEGAEEAVPVPARAPHRAVLRLQAADLVPEHRAALPVLCSGQHALMEVTRCCRMPG